MILLWTIAVAALLLYLFFFRSKGSSLNRPPGPYQWPLIGNTAQLGGRPYLKFVEWTKKYGKIFQINMGGGQTVVLSDVKLIRDAFNDSNLTGRPRFELFTALQDGAHGLINSDGDEWMEQRRWSLRHLRDFGFGKRAMEDLILDEVKELLLHLKSVEGQDVDLKEKLSLVVVNALWMMVAGNRYDLNDPDLLELYRKMTRFNEEMSPALLFPRFAKLFPKLSGLNKLNDLVKDTRGFVGQAVEDHVKNRPMDSNESRDFIDVYLQQIDNTTDPNSSFYKEQGKTSLMATIVDLFMAGLETTSSTLYWSFLYLTKFPEIQSKMQSELDSVTGKNRNPTLADRPNLSFCEATVLEILRKSSIVPTGLIHVATTDMKLEGYDIPKGTWVTANMYYCHHSEDLWENPNEFNPSRFLVKNDTGDGWKVKKPDALMPFSVGKRVCMGENMALASVFLFLTSILQKFNVRLAQESQNVSLQSKPGLAVYPERYKIVLTERT